MSQSNRMKNCGFSLLEVMIGLGLSAIITLAFVSYQDLTLKSSAETRVKATLESYRMAFKSTLEDPESFYETVRLNATNFTAASGMACLWRYMCSPTKGLAAVPTYSCPAPGAACITGQPNLSFNLYRAEGTLIYSALSPTSGVSLNEKLCTTYNSATGNLRCPLRFDLRWRVECAAGCTSPVVLIRATLDTSFPATGPGVSVYRSLKSLQQDARAFPELRIPVTLGRQTPFFTVISAIVTPDPTVPLNLTVPSGSATINTLLAGEVRDTDGMPAGRLLAKWTSNLSTATFLPANASFAQDTANHPLTTTATFAGPFPQTFRVYLEAAEPVLPLNFKQSVPFLTVNVTCAFPSTWNTGTNTCQ